MKIAGPVSPMIGAGFLLAAMLFSGTASAQTPSETLARVARTYQGLSSFSADFSQVIKGGKRNRDVIADTADIDDDGCRLLGKQHS